jgi:hypothetical protein
MTTNAASAIAATAPGATATPAAAKTGTGGDFSAALTAAEKARARQEAQDAELKTIKEKGFTAWVRDTSREKLKEELRKRVMASMGLTDDDLAKMTGVMQQILEQKIKDEVEKRLAQQLKDSPAGSGTESGDGKAQKPSQEAKPATASDKAQTAAVTLAAQEEVSNQDAAPTGQPGKKDRDGIYCPVIPALAMSGGTPLF